MKRNKRASSHKLAVLHDVVLVGASVPRHLSDALGVLSVYCKTSRSNIIRALIAERLGKEDMAHMTFVLAQRILKSWNSHCLERGEDAVNFTQYRQKTRSELTAKKINPIYIQKIMAKAKDLYETSRKVNTQ